MYNNGRHDRRLNPNFVRDSTVVKRVPKPARARLKFCKIFEMSQIASPRTGTRHGQNDTFRQKLFRLGSERAPRAYGKFLLKKPLMDGPNVPFRQKLFRLRLEHT